jgi:hypothetical protein
MKETTMKALSALALGASAAVMIASAAQAAGGCGPAFHRGPYGRCVPNGGAVVVGPGAWTVGVFYPGRGYWDGHRWWAHRERWHGGWRYR